MKRSLQIALGALALAGGTAAQAQLVITPTYTANVDADFGSNATAFKNAFSYAAAQISSNFSDAIHINITVDAVNGTGVLGQSDSVYGPLVAGPTGYGLLRTAAINDAKTADDFTSINAGGSLNSTTAGSSSISWYATKAEQKALGMVADDSTRDGTVTFGAGFNYTFDPNNRAAPGLFDMIGVMMHEITEVMGRQGDAGTNDYQPVLAAQLLDAFRFTGPGARGLNNGAGNFMSIDAGTHLLLPFNDRAANGGDSSDWETVFGAPDSFDAAGAPGELAVLSETDLRTLDVIGYDRVSTVPLPTSAWLLLSGLAGLTLLSRRRATTDFS